MDLKITGRTAQTLERWLNMDFTYKMVTRVDCLEELYKNTNSGHWFDRDTMRFFNTRLPGDFKRLNDKTALFISTEKNGANKRQATLRLATIVDLPRENGDMVSKVNIDTIGEFNVMSLYMARKMLNAFTENDLQNYIQNYNK